MSGSNNQPKQSTVGAAANLPDEEAKSQAAICDDRYRRIFDAAQVGIVIIDATTAIIEDANSGFEQLTGYKRADIIGTNLWEKRCCLREIFVDKAGFVSFLREGAVRQAIMNITASDGRQVPVEIDANIYDEVGKKTVRFVLRDVTDRKRMEDKIKINDERFRRFFDESSVGMVLVGLDTKFLRVNRTFCEMLGYDEIELLGKSFTEVSHPDYGVSDRQNITALVKGEIPVYNTVKRYLTKDGREVWGSTRANLVRDAAGQPRHLQAIIQDITAQRAAELALAKDAEREVFLLDVYDRVALFSDKELYDFILDRVVKLTDSSIGFLHRVTDDQQNIVLTTWNGQAMQECSAPKTGHYPLEKAGNWVDCVRERRPIIYNEYVASPHQKGLPSGHVGLKRFMSVPVFEGDQVRIIFGVGNKEQPYDNRDITQVQLVATTLLKIINQRKVDREVREREEAYRGIFESSRDAYVLYENGILIDCNGAAVKLFGAASREQIIGKRPEDLSSPVQPDGRSSKEAAREDVLSVLAGKHRQFEWLHRRLDGRDFLAEVTLSTVAFQGRTVIHGVIRDLSERDREAKMFMLAFHAAPYTKALSVIETGEYIEVNEAFLRLTGYKREEVLGRTSIELGILSAEDRQRAMEAMRSSGRLQGLELNVRQKGGGRRICRFAAEPILVGDRKMLLTIAEDITDQRAAEAAMKKSQDLATKYFEIGGGISLILDVVGKVVIINHLGAEMLGYRAEEMVGLSWFDTFIPERLRLQMQNAFRVIMENGGENAVYENSVLHKNGQEKIVLWHNVVLVDEDGQLTGTMSSGIDVTARRTAETAMRRSEADLRDAQRYARVGSWRWYIQTGELEWSDEMYRIFGIDQKNFSGKLAEVMASAIHPDDRAKVDVSNRSVMEKGQPIPVEYRVIRPDGAEVIVWAEAGEMTRDANGKPETLVGIVQDVTELRKSARELAVVRERYTQLFTTLPICVYRNTSGPKGRFIEVNPAMVEMFEAGSKEDLLNISVSDLYVNPKERALTSEKILKQGFIKSEIVRLKTLKGRELWGSVTAVLKKDEANQPYFDGSIEDVTTRVDTSLALKESEKRFRQIWEDLPDALYTIDLMGNFLDGNQAAEKIIGYSRQQLIGKSMIGIGVIAPVDLPRIAKLLLMNIAGKSTGPDVFNLKRKDGTTITVEIRTTPTVIDGKRLVLSVARDVSDRQKAIHDLAESEVKFRTFIEKSQDVVYAFDSSAIMTYVSPRVSVYGYKDEDVVGRNFFDFIHPDDVSQVKVALDKYLKSSIFVPTEMRIRQADGHFAWVEVDGTLNKGTDGKGADTIGVIRHIDERKRAEERARELDVLKNKFIQVVSHQMRTPLSSVRWGLEELLAGKMGAVTEGQREILRMSHGANVEVISRIGDLLTAMDIEEGRVRLEPEQLILEDLVRSTCAKYRAKFELKRLTHAYEFPDGQSTEISADPEKICSVLDRLIDNAVGYTPEGGKLSTRVKVTGRMVRFEMVDTGIGMPRGEISHLFQRFHRFSNAALIKPDGSGLGLYIAKNIIEVHGGTMGCESEEGKGTTVWFELPLA